MARVFGLLSFLALTVVVVAVIPRAEAGDPPTLKIGLPENMFAGLPPSVVQPASKPFQAMFEKQTGWKGEVEIGKDYEDLANKMRGGKVDIAVFHGFEYAWVRQHKELVPLVVTMPASKLQGCLVVPMKSKARDASDLKGDCIAIPASTKAFSRHFLDRLKCGLPAGCCGTAKMEGKSVDEVLDAVAGGNCEAALVDAAALVAYQKNKPGVGEQLRVLAESEVFPPAVVVYRKDAFNAAQVGKVRDGLIKGMTTPQGQLLASLWKLKGFETPTDQYQTELDKWLKANPPPKPK